jgi:hypothetical protein
MIGYGVQHYIVKQATDDWTIECMAILDLQKLGTTSRSSSMMQNETSLYSFHCVKLLHMQTANKGRLFSTELHVDVVQYGYIKFVFSHDSLCVQLHSNSLKLLHFKDPLWKKIPGDSIKGH